MAADAHTGDNRPVDTTILQSDGAKVSRVDHRPAKPTDAWLWIDVLADESDLSDVQELLATYSFDTVALTDAFADANLPEVDDFGTHVVMALHGLRGDRIETSQVACFFDSKTLITVHETPSPAIDALRDTALTSPTLAPGGADELAGRLADVLTRRLLAVVDAFEQSADGLIVDALDAEPGLLRDAMAVRSDLSTVRRVVNPQRETLDVLRGMTSTVVSDAGRRRFSDAFDVADRTTHGLDSARATVSDIIDVYRGAESTRATEVTKVLTIYAAVLLPLNLLAAFFGMNFVDLPWLGDEWGWVWATAVMVGVAVLSLGVFVALGWIGRPSGRTAGQALGRGLIEAAKAPVHVAGAIYEMSTMPLHGTTGDRGRTQRRTDR